MTYFTSCISNHAWNNIHHTTILNTVSMSNPILILHPHRFLLSVVYRHTQIITNITIEVWYSLCAHECCAHKACSVPSNLAHFSAIKTELRWNGSLHHSTNWRVMMLGWGWGHAQYQDEVMWFHFNMAHVRSGRCTSLRRVVELDRSVVSALFTLRLWHS